MTWHRDILPPETARGLAYLAGCTWLKEEAWYLAGGTALALQVGHRASVDLDFFTPRDTVDIPTLRAHLSQEPAFITDQEAPNTLYGRLQGAQISFIAYPFFIPKEKYLFYQSVPVLHERDIAVMKIVAISQRGRKRDFVDLYWYAKNRESLLDICLRLSNQYPSVAHDYQHIIKALMYFDDAEADVMPELRFDASWEGIKAHFHSEAPQVAKTLLHLE